MPIALLIPRNLLAYLWFDSVLIITGDTDRLVPSWNAERLSWAIPGSTLEVIKNCGHLPHEERVEEFLLAVERFLQKILGVSNRQFSQAAAWLWQQQILVENKQFFGIQIPTCW